MPRRREAEEHENHERWLVSYADFITLLFAFFVVMYSISSVNEGKMRVLSDSIVASFADRKKSLEPIQVGKLVRSPATDDVSPVTHPKPISTGTLVPTPGVDLPKINSADAKTPDRAAEAPDAVPEMEDVKLGTDGEGDGEGGQLADRETVAAQVEETMAPLIADDLVAVRRKDDGVEVEIKTSLLFTSGSARIEAKAIGLLQELAGTLAAFENPVHVQGYTDNVPISTLAYPSNWELSAARAASVVHLFMKLGLRPGRMAAVGFGEYRPAADNATPEGRAKNRRVVIVIPADKPVQTVDDGQQLVDGGLGWRAPQAEVPALQEPKPANSTVAGPVVPPSGSSARF